VLPFVQGEPHLRLVLPFSTNEEEGCVMNEELAESLAKREALFRAANEEIARADEQFGRDGEALEIICECGRNGCAELISVPRGEYEQARAQPRRFLLVPGHELLEIERVVGRYDGVVVVEKQEPTAAAIAEEAARPTRRLM
jgi:hypothetical protein